MKILVATILLAVPAAAIAQQQVVKPPVANYWVNVETAAGMGIPGMEGMGGFMAGMMGGGQAQGGRKMVLQLGSQRPADGGPRADHFIPSGMSMGPSLPVLTPQRAPVERTEREEGLPQGMEQPKGRMLIYWGCGENARAGQPVIIDFAKLGQGQTPPNMVSRRVSAPSGPSPSRAKTYGDWPNQQNTKAVPDSASLRGDHQIKGNYSPDIQFALGEDFMDRVELSNAARGNGAVNVSWNAVGTATGYFATVFGSDGNDMVMWSSSELQEMGGMLMNYVPPAEVARLVREKIVLAPSVTECTVPAEVVKRAGGSPFLNFIAYGPEANFAQPPRPQDPKQAWEPLWTVKARFKSTASTLLGDASGGGGRRPARTQGPSQAPAAAEAGAEQTAEPAQKTGPDPLKEGVNILRGIFGR